MNGETHVFGNHGALWMNAMTWFDHATGSIWTQPWGRALAGEFKGTQLKILPVSLVPWETWKAEHPDTLALVLNNRGFYGRETVRDDFVAGVAIGEFSRGYHYRGIAEDVVLNDVLGEIPLVIHTNPDTRSIRIFVRQLSDGTLLTFEGDAEQLIDVETGTIWDTVTGLAIEGELAGTGLREIPYVSSFVRDWRHFFPNTDFYPSSAG